MFISLHTYSGVEARTNVQNTVLGNVSSKLCCPRWLMLAYIKRSYADSMVAELIRFVISVNKSESHRRCHWFQNATEQRVIVVTNVSRFAYICIYKVYVLYLYNLVNSPRKFILYSLYRTFSRPAATALVLTSYILYAYLLSTRITYYYYTSTYMRSIISFLNKQNSRDRRVQNTS